MQNVLLSQARPSVTYPCSVHTPGGLWGTGSPDAGPWREGWALPGSLLLPDLTCREARAFSPLGDLHPLFPVVGISTPGAAGTATVHLTLRAII